MTPEATYLTALFGVLAIIGWGGAVDLTLWLRGELTISAWLRLHPLWFLVPAAIVLVFIAAMIFHLFVEVPLNGPEKAQDVGRSESGRSEC